MEAGGQGNIRLSVDLWSTDGVELSFSANGSGRDEGNASTSKTE